jgi:HK97 family phage prohead protease
MTDALAISGYASRFWQKDLADDLTVPGSFAASLATRGSRGVKMLYQHDPLAPIGLWDEIAEDDLGLKVRGRILPITAAGRMCAALAEAGVLEGLSIGFRTVKARRDGSLRVLTEVDLWEVSLVTFPMLPGARLTVG